MTKLNRLHRRLALTRCHDSSGVSTIEFALVAPVFLTLVIGIFDIGQMGYANAVLNGAVQKAARDSSLETSNTTAADNMVKAQIKPILPGVVISSTRTSYFDFNDVGRQERFNDGNADGTCNNNEPFVDENGNGEWDADIGVDGNGNASDVVVYKVTASYNPIFKVPFMPSAWQNRTLTATAIRKNQPFAYQEGYGSSSGVCN